MGVNRRFNSQAHKRVEDEAMQDAPTGNIRELSNAGTSQAKRITNGSPAVIQTRLRTPPHGATTKSARQPGFKHRQPTKA